MSARSGFTFIEVLAGLIILVVGLFALIALVMYGQRLATRAQAQAQGMSTALSVTVDASPLVAAPADWTTSWAGDNCTSRGWINGLWVERDETSTVADRITPEVRSAQVVVRVREGVGGAPVAGVTTRIMRQKTASYTP